ncbi:MAG: hypothetical protein V4481_01365 [Patescibacteria group bacterium]
MENERRKSTVQRRLDEDSELSQAAEAFIRDLRTVAGQEREVVSVDPLYKLPMIYPFAAWEVGL